MPDNNLQICFNAGCSSFSRCDECLEKEAAKAEIIRQLREAYPAPNFWQSSNRIYKDLENSIAETGAALMSGDFKTADAKIECREQWEKSIRSLQSGE